MKQKVGNWILRLCYRILYRIAEAGIACGSDIVYGFARKFRAPKDVPDEDLPNEIDRLAKALQGAS